MAKKAAAGNGGVASEMTAAKPSAKAVTKEAGSAVGADSAIKASAAKGNGKAGASAKGKAQIEVTDAMIAEAAYFLHMNGVPGTPEEHWAQAESQLRSSGSAQM